MWHALARTLLMAASLEACARSGLESPMDADGDGMMDVLPDPQAEQAGADAPEPVAPVSTVSTFPTQPPVSAVPPPTGLPTQRPAGTAWVAACFVPPYTGDAPIVVEECVTRIDAIDRDTGAEIFHDDSREGGAACNADVPLGTHVELRVDIANPLCRLVTWGPGFLASAGLPCPCANTSTTSCQFTVEHDVYCGAVFAMDP